MSIKARLRRLLNPGESLSQRVVCGGFWVFVSQCISRSLGFIRTIILARILAPNDFGLMGIAFLGISILQTFSQTGIGAALIQNKDNISEHLDTVWTIQLVRGVVLFLLLFSFAPLIAHFFNAPRAKLIIQVIAIGQLFDGLTNIGIIYFQKELEFHKQFFYNISCTLLEIIVAITAALILKNVWALVFGHLAGSFMRFILSYVFHPYRPKLKMDWEKAKELLNFGKWIWGSTVLIFLLTQGDDIFVGKLLGATALGFYQMAYQLSNLPATEITHVISGVTFPAYAKLQDDLPSLREAYLKVLQITLFLSFPIAGMIFILAPDFTRIFLGERWMPMVPAMQVLAIFGATRSFGATTGPIFQAIGKPSILTKLAFIQLIMMIVIIYPLTDKFGIFGTAIAVVIPNIITQFIAGIQVLNIIKCNKSEFIKPILFPLVSTATMILLVVLFINVPKELTIYYFLALILLGAVGYLGISYLLGRKFDYNTMKILFQSLGQGMGKNVY